MSCKMSADKTKAVLNVEIKMFPFQISYVKICILSETREEFLPGLDSVGGNVLRFPPPCYRSILGRWQLLLQLESLLSPLIPGRVFKF